MTAIDPRMLEGALTDSEKAVRDFFVQEYLKDHDAYRACIRIGFMANFAVDYARLFMADGYVLRQIAHMTRRTVEPSEADRAEMLENLRWLAHNGTPSSRAQATKTYMEVQGYLKREDEGEETRVGAIVDALKEFAQNAPQ